MKNRQSIRSKQFNWRRGMLLVLLLALLGVAVQPAYAAVNCADSSWSVGDETDLNAAIVCYNAKTTAGSYTITLTADIPLTTSTTAINNAIAGVDLTIEGAGKTVNGQNNSGVRPFKLSSANTRPVTFNRITITGGYVPSDSGGGIEVQNGYLTVTNSTIAGNRADTGGGISICSFTGCGLTLQNSTISGNRADSSYGGGILVSGPATIDSSTIVSNTACSACGGALGVTGSTGQATVTNSILANSTDGSSAVRDCAFSLGGATVTDGGYNLVEDAGSCSFTATGSITGSDPQVGSLANNGGPTQTHALLTGSPAINAGSTTLTTDQRGAVRPFGIADDIGAFEATPQSGPNFVVNASADTDDGSCDLAPGNCTLREAINAANALAGADTITFNIPSGGACASANTCTITLSDSLPDITTEVTIDGSQNNAHITIDGAGQYRPFYFASGSTGELMNLAITNGLGPSLGVLYGGALRNDGTLTIKNCYLYSNMSPYGGAISNIGTLIVTDSTFDGNTATLDGAGIRNIGTATITNSTFADNAAGANGGGFQSSGTATITNSTFSGNVAPFGGGNAIATSSGTTTVKNTILADGASNCSGTITDGGYNIDRGVSCSFGATSLSITDPKLGTFANGVFPLNTNSPAIDGVSVGGGNGCPTTDQRGQARNDLYCDIGAYELVYTDSHSVTHTIPDTTTFSFGPALAELQPGAGSTSFPGTTTVTRNTWANQPANAVKSFWNISAATQTGLDMNVAFCVADLNGLIANNLRLYGYSGGTWTTVGTFVETNNILHSPYYCTYTKDINNLTYSAYTLATGDPVNAPTAADLVAFGARFRAKQERVNVKWQTGTELNILGFNLYRAVGKTGTYKQLNAELIPAKNLGQVLGASYILRDTQVKAGKTYFYKLQVVYADGAREMSSRVRVVVK